MKIYSYNENSEGAKALAKALGIKRIRHEGKKLVVKDGVLNWGASEFQRDMAYAGVINCPTRIKVASNKLHSFQAFGEAAWAPKWTDDEETAAMWHADGKAIVLRHKLTGHSGEGIEIVEADEAFVGKKAPLYVQYIPKKEEYRIHVNQEQVFFVQRKARKNDVADEQVNWKVRNHQNGFIYANKGVEVAEIAKKYAIEAIKAIGLDFGAVDIIYNAKNDAWYVLEVNTAPGLSGTTLEKYVEQFKQYL